MSTSVKVNNVWRKSSIQENYVKVNGQFRTIRQKQVKVNNVWRWCDHLLYRNDPGIAYGANVDWHNLQGQGSIYCHFTTPARMDLYTGCNQPLIFKGFNQAMGETRRYEIQPYQPFPVFNDPRSDCMIYHQTPWVGKNVFLGNESNPLCAMLLVQVQRNNKTIYEFCWKSQADFDAFWNAVKYFAFDLA